MDYAIVTIKFEQLDWQCDMELPVKMKFKYLMGKILETLKMHDEERFQSVSQIVLSYKGNRISADLAMIDYQIWDGAVLNAQI